MQYFSCGSDKYSEIKICDLEPFSKIQSHFVLSKSTIWIPYACKHMYNKFTGCIVIDLPEEPDVRDSVELVILCELNLFCSCVHQSCMYMYTLFRSLSNFAK